MMSWLKRNVALLYGLAFGGLVIGLYQLALRPDYWFPERLGRVVVAGNCGYSQLAVAMLRANEYPGFVALPASDTVLEFETEVCRDTLKRLQEEGRFWIGLLPEKVACARLVAYTVELFEQDTPAKGYPTWMSGQGEYLGVGMDPEQVAKVGLTPPPSLVADWIEGGYDAERIAELGFVIPSDARPAMPLDSAAVSSAP